MGTFYFLSYSSGHCFFKWHNAVWSFIRIAKWIWYLNVLLISFLGLFRIYCHRIFCAYPKFMISPMLVVTRERVVLFKNRQAAGKIKIWFHIAYCRLHLQSRDARLNQLKMVITGWSCHWIWYRNFQSYLVGFLFSLFVKCMYLFSPLICWVSVLAVYLLCVERRVVWVRKE